MKTLSYDFIGGNNPSLNSIIDQRIEEYENAQEPAIPEGLLPVYYLEFSWWGGGNMGSKLTGAVIKKIVDAYKNSTSQDHQKVYKLLIDTPNGLSESISVYQTGPTPSGYKIQTLVGNNSKYYDIILPYTFEENQTYDITVTEHSCLPDSTE